MGSPSTAVANFTYFLYICMRMRLSVRVSFN